MWLKCGAGSAKIAVSLRRKICLMMRRFIAATVDNADRAGL
jgi:hypothetical protein